MRLSFRKPAKFVKELDSPEQQHANTHQLFIKLCWLIDKHASQRRPRREHRRDFVPPPPGASDRVGPQWRQAGSAARQHLGGVTTFTVAFGMDRGPLDMLVQIVHAGKTDAGAALARAHSPRHNGERLGHHDHDLAIRGHIGRRDEPEQRRISVDPSLGHGQHPRQRGHPGRHEGRIRTRRIVLHPAA